MDVSMNDLLPTMTLGKVSPVGPVVEHRQSFCNTDEDMPYNGLIDGCKSFALDIFSQVSTFVVVVHHSEFASASIDWRMEIAHVDDGVEISRDDIPQDVDLEWNSLGRVNIPGRVGSHKLISPISRMEEDSPTLSTVSVVLVLPPIIKWISCRAFWTIKRYSSIPPMKVSVTRMSDNRVIVMMMMFLDCWASI